MPEDRPGGLRRHLAKEGLLARLDRLDAGAELDARIALVNIDVDRLDALLDQQNYRLARWQAAGFELDYRRFFDIANLAALRMEDPDVFADTHVRIMEWLRQGVLDGVRVDHPDGLAEPAAPRAIPPVLKPSALAAFQRAVTGRDNAVTPASSPVVENEL